jgi:hypothetical protein
VGYHHRSGKARPVCGPAYLSPTRLTSSHRISANPDADTLSQGMIHLHHRE